MRKTMSPKIKVIKNVAIFTFNKLFQFSIWKQEIDPTEILIP